MAKLVNRPTPSRFAAAAKREVNLTEAASLKHHSDEVWNVCFSHDGTRLASSGADTTAIIYSVEDFEVLHILNGHAAGIGSVFWSPDDKKIVTCSQDYTATLWDTKTGQPLEVLSGFNGPVTSCAWLPNSEEFITTALACLDNHMNLCLWSVDGISIHKFALEAPILGCVLLPDDKVASFDNRKHIYVHDLQTKKMVKVSNSEVELSSMCSSKLGKPFALFLRKDGLLEMIDVRTMELVKVFKMKSYGNFVINATFGGEEEEFVASGSEGGDLYIWETGTGELLLKEKVHTAPESCNCIAWNPKMHGMIATAGDDHTVRILAINEDEETWEHVESEDTMTE